MAKRSFTIPLPRCEVMAYYHICAHLRWGDTAVDVGAHVGHNSILAATLVGPPGRVLAVEPVPALRQELEANIAKEKLYNIAVLPFAATSPEHVQKQQQAPQKMYVDTVRPLPMMNRFWIEKSEEQDYKTIPIICRTVDQITAKIPEVHLLKIDVEGCDVEVLKGAGSIIERSSNIAILIELWPYGLAQNGNSTEEMLEILISHGFIIYILDERQKQPRRIDHMTNLDLPRPDRKKPESLINSQVQNLWCVRKCWDIDYDADSKSPHTVGNIEVVWDAGSELDKQI